MSAMSALRAPVQAADMTPNPATPSARRPPAPGPVIGNQARLRRLSQIVGAPIQAKLSLGAVDDPLETEADRAADQVMRMSAPDLALAAAPPTVSRKCAACDEEEGTLRPKAATPNGSAATAPPSVHAALSASGRALDARVQDFFGARFGHDFSTVRLHDDAAAARSARAIEARAYTVGEHVVLGPDGADDRLLAHELAHVVQQRAGTRPWIQRDPPPAPAPRQDYVFIMGADKKKIGFYALAKMYFQAHQPAATIIDDPRSLGEVLQWMASNVKAPIGNVYLVSHGNEDGTLAFGVDAADDDHSMSVPELRDKLHPAGGGKTTLTDVSAVVDAKTTIHIKGCDIGRTQAVVELIDEAFGGAGTVTAPTHEQVYSTDPTLAAQARKTEHDSDMAAFEATLPPLPAAPTPVDKTLKGDDLKQAKADFDAATQALKDAKAARKAALADEEKRIKPDVAAAGDLAGTIDSLSGPMFQRPGTALFKLDELQSQVDATYADLPDAQRKTMAKQLVAPDKGGEGNQFGQRVKTVKAYSVVVGEPASLAEGKLFYAKSLKAAFFTAKSMTSTSAASDAGTDITTTFTGTVKEPGEAARDDTLTTGDTVEDEATMIAKGKAAMGNPERYAWRVEKTHAATGGTTYTAIGERVMAYLHHGSLDPSAHDRYRKSESDSTFYAASTFAPPPPPSASPAAPATP